MVEFLKDECDPLTCTTGIHLDIDTGKTLNACPICEVHHNDPDGSYRILAMGMNGTECIVQKNEYPTNKFVFKPAINTSAVFNNDTWIKMEEKTPSIDTLIITKDKYNGDIYIGKLSNDGWFNGKHIDLGGFILGPISRFVWKSIEDFVERD
jgi:hypothetical protein